MTMRDVIGDFKTDMLMSEMQDFTEKLNKWGLKSPRPWNEFAGILKKPKNKQELEERLQTNFMLYKANYILLLAGIMSWSVIISPFTMGVLFVCAGVFALLLGWPQPLEIFGRLLTPKEKTMIAASFTFFLLLITGAMVKLIWSFSLGVSLIVAHMSFRPRCSGHRKGIIDDANLSQSPTKIVEDIESPNNEDSGLNSYHSEIAQLRATAHSMSRDGRD
ncbi:rab acceptor 1 [Nannochloropsis gaditana CCMP526]|nr:rab acceptor 1 [Nannochloropsis gaditana CCMP526]EKU21383.1 rab acceptor 1 [Nannochloropsis gaditana CCMP526]|eukprot:XP_005854972.1 rab acceptor 1 [Nannochloropsis gaditana CCMP526]